MKMKALLQYRAHGRVRMPERMRFLISLLLLLAFWFQTDARIVGCHGDNALCGSDASAAECACVCHDAFAPAANANVYLDRPKMERVSFSDETIRDLLIPNDIFRPPLTNS